MVAAALFVLLAVVLPVLPTSDAAFTSTTSSAGNTFSTTNMYFLPRVTASHELRDFSTGTETTGVIDRYADADGRTQTPSKGWGTVFDVNSYMEVRFASSLPNGFPVNNARLQVSFGSSASNVIFCAIFEVYQLSGGSYVPSQQFGSTTNPFCTTDIIALTLSLNAGATTTSLNGLAVRILGRMEKDTYRSIFDEVTLRGDMVTYGTTTPVVQHVVMRDERMYGGPSDVSYSVAKEDTRTYTSASTWPTTPSASRYMSATLPWTGRSSLPDNATVTKAQLLHSWRPSGASDACYQVKVYSSAGTLLGQSDPAALRCHAAGSVSSRDVWDLSAWLRTPAEVRGARVEFVYRSGDGATSTEHDYIALEATYGIP